MASVNWILNMNFKSAYSMLPPGSADISHMANILCGNAGAPTLVGSHGV